MDASFGQAISEWTGFFAYLGAGSATLLGLLFVSVSLRLNLFRESQVVDVRDFAVQSFGQFFALVLIAALFLMPDQRPAGVGLPVAILGLIGGAWLAHLVRDSIRVNAAGDPTAILRNAIVALTTVVNVGLIGCGLVITAGHTSALLWLAILSLAVLTLAVFGAWMLLTHARGG